MAISKTKEFNELQPGSTEWRRDIHHAFDKILIKLQTATSRHGVIIDNITKTNINKTLLSAMDRIKEDYFNEIEKDRKDRLYTRLMLLISEYREFLIHATAEQSIHNHISALIALVTRDMYPDQ